MSKTKAVPPCGTFESLQRSSIVDIDYKDIFKLLPDNSRIVRKHLRFEDAEDGSDLLAKFVIDLPILFDELGATEQPAVVINIDRPECKPDLSLGDVASIFQSIEQICDASVIWGVTVSNGDHYSIDLLIEVR